MLGFLEPVGFEEFYMNIVYMTGYEQVSQLCTFDLSECNFSVIMVTYQQLNAFFFGSPSVQTVGVEATLQEVFSVVALET